MPARDVLSQARIDHIRADFEGNPALSLSEIGARGGVSRKTVSRLARRYGWTRARTDWTPPPPAAPVVSPAPGGSGAPAPVAGTRADLLDGLWHAVTRHVGELKAGQGEGAASAQSLMAIVRTVEKLMDMERDAAQAGAELDQGLADIDEFRNEIARRLEAMRPPAPEAPVANPAPEVPVEEPGAGSTG